jgi:hypothetical protein
LQALDTPHLFLFPVLCRHVYPAAFFFGVCITLAVIAITWIKHISAYSPKNGIRFLSIVVMELVDLEATLLHYAMVERAYDN